MATQHHSEVSVKNSSQLITPALLNWHTDARTKLIIDCIGRMRISPASHDFGQAVTNTSTELKQFTITNGTSGTVTLDAFTAPVDLGLAAPFSFQNGDTNLCYGGKTLLSGATCTIKVAANSSVDGTFNDALEMPFRDSNNVDGSVTATVKVLFAH